MTVSAPIAATRSNVATVYIAATAGGAVLAAVALLGVPGYPWLALACFGAAAAAIAVIDVRTKLLPNRYTGPLAIAAGMQAAAVTVHDRDLWIAGGALVAATIVFAAYVAMGMVGWFGFGDAKFAAGLALFAGIFAGWLAIYLVPLAVLLSGLERALRMLRGTNTRSHAHGPAIAIAGTAIAAIGILA